MKLTNPCSHLSCYQGMCSWRKLYCSQQGQRMTEQNTTRLIHETKQYLTLHQPLPRLVLYQSTQPTTNSRSISEDIWHGGRVFNIKMVIFGIPFPCLSRTSKGMLPFLVISAPHHQQRLRVHVIVSCVPAVLMRTREWQKTSWGRRIILVRSAKINNHDIETCYGLHVWGIDTNKMFQNLQISGNGSIQEVPRGSGEKHMKSTGLC